MKQTGGIGMQPTKKVKCNPTLRLTVAFSRSGNARLPLYDTGAMKPLPVLKRTVSEVEGESRSLLTDLLTISSKPSPLTSTKSCTAAVFDIVCAMPPPKE